MQSKTQRKTPRKHGDCVISSWHYPAATEQKHQQRNDQTTHKTLLCLGLCAVSLFGNCRDWGLRARVHLRMKFRTFTGTKWTIHRSISKSHVPVLSYGYWTEVPARTRSQDTQNSFMLGLLAGSLLSSCSTSPLETPSCFLVSGGRTPSQGSFWPLRPWIWSLICKEHIVWEMDEVDTWYVMWIVAYYLMAIVLLEQLQQWCAGQKG